MDRISRWWKNGNKILVMSILHLNSVDRLVESVLRLPVFSSSSCAPVEERAARLQAYSCRWKIWPCLKWVGDRKEPFTRHRCTCRVLDTSYPIIYEIDLSKKNWIREASAHWRSLAILHSAFNRSKGLKCKYCTPGQIILEWSSLWSIDLLRG